MDRCPWCTSTPLYMEYHDKEWGVPVHDDQKFFEFLILEGAQAGLSWITILNRRENYRAAFDGFDPHMVARYDEKKRLELLANPGIIRNKLKVNGAVKNAKALLAFEKEGGDFSAFLWSFVGGQPKVNAFASMDEVPATTPDSDAMSKALKKMGFTFVGSTICYAFMQACGMVNDHLTDCFCYKSPAARG